MNDTSHYHINKRRSRAKRDHTPSRYRAIIREAKEGKQGRKIYSLVREARNLDDPYYASLALLTLSRDRRLGSEAACSAAENALKLCSRVEREWRQAELLIELTRRVVDWRQQSTNPETGTFRRYLLDRLLEQVEVMLPGNGLSDAVKGMTPLLPYYLHDFMLGQALRDRGSVVDDTRAVIRAMISGISEAGSGEEVTTTPSTNSNTTLSPTSTKLPMSITSTPQKSITTIVGTLSSIQDPVVRAKLLGYLHLQIRKSIPEQLGTILQDAIQVAETITDEQQRLEILRYLSTIARTSDEFNSLSRSVGQFEDKASGIRLATTMAGNADKAGKRDLAVNLLLNVLGQTREIEEDRERAVLFSNIALGLSRCGRSDDSVEAFHLSLQSCSQMSDIPRRSGIAERIRKHLGSLEIPEEGMIAELLHQILDRAVEERPVEETHKESGDRPKVGDPRVKNRNDGKGREERSGISGTGRIGEERIISERMGNAGNEERAVSGRADMAENASRERGTASIEQSYRNHILALYDAYEGAMKPVHFRAIARAAPLCTAFDLDLALMGFPGDDLDLIVDQTIKETNIGKGGKLLRELAISGRILLIPPNRSGSDWDMNKHGIPIGTTSHPDPNRSMTLEGLQKKIADREIDPPLCLVMGLGRRGLPASLLSSFPYHLELTGRNIPLETCTVMGVIAERLSSLPR